MTQSPTDRDLVARFLAEGDLEAASALMERYLQPVRSFALHLGTHINDVDDITQEVMINAIKNLKLFRAESSLSTWIYSIALNRCRKYLRKKSSSEVPQAIDQPIVDPNFSSPSHRVELSETSNEIDRAIQSLPDAAREAIVLVSIHGMSVSQGARVCGCTTNAFSVRLHQARKLLKQKLAGYFE